MFWMDNHEIIILKNKYVEFVPQKKKKINWMNNFKRANSDLYIIKYVYIKISA